MFHCFLFPVFFLSFNDFVTSIQYEILVKTTLYLQCVLEVDKINGLTLTELADGVSVEDVLSSTGCKIHVAEKIKKMGDVTKPEQVQ